MANGFLRRFLGATEWVGVCLILTWNAAGDDQVSLGQKWSIVAKEPQKIVLTEKAGVLQIQYDLAIDTLKQVGFLGLKEGTAELRLKEPIPLRKDQARVFFEAHGIETGASNHGETAILLRPILRDSVGTTFYYYPLEYPHLNTGTSQWTTWMTPEFDINEAGGPSDQLYDTQGTAGNVTPRGDLAFAGFQLVVCGKAFGRGTGELALGSIDFRGSIPPYQPPFAYIESLLPNEKGDYVIGAVIRNEFQGTPLKEFKRPFSYDPVDLASGRQKMVFPLGPDDVYWIDYQVYDATGHPLAKGSIQDEAVGTGVDAPLKPADLSQAPVVGQMRINPDSHGNGVYGANEKPDVTVRLFGAGSRVLSWELLSYGYDTVLEKGELDGSLAGDKSRDVTIPLQWQPGRDAYRLKLTLKSGDKILDDQTYVLGRTIDLAKPYNNRVGKIMDRDYVKQHSYSRVTYVGNKALKTEDESVAEFNRELDDISSLTHHVTCLIEATDLEVLPGVYDFAQLDRMVDAAADHGCAVTFRFTVANGKQFPWQKYCRTRSSDGLEMRIAHKTQILPVASDPRYLAIYDHAFKALHDRYATHPGYQGIYIMTAVGDWGDAYADLPWTGTISGYDPASHIAFRTYLKETLHLSLADLNARWGTAYTSWDEVAPPQPDFALAGQPQLDRPWLDFCEFKESWSKEWFVHLASTIRSYDPNHVIICYTNKSDGLLDIADYLHNGGNQFLTMEGTLVDAWEKHHLGWISEPNHPYRWAAYGDPAEKGWVLDWSFYIATAQAGGGGWNLHIYYDPQKKHRSRRPLWRKLCSRSVRKIRDHRQ